MENNMENNMENKLLEIKNTLFEIQKSNRDANLYWNIAIAIKQINDTHNIFSKLTNSICETCKKQTKGKYRWLGSDKEKYVCLVCFENETNDENYNKNKTT